MPGEASRLVSARELPEERDHPLDRLLDAWETLTRDLVERDCEPQVRARLERLLPAQGGQEAVGSRQSAVGGTERELAFAAVLAALSTVDQFRKAKEHAAQIAAAKAFVLGELAALKAARSGGAP